VLFRSLKVIFLFVFILSLVQVVVNIPVHGLFQLLINAPSAEEEESQIMNSERSEKNSVEVSPQGTSVSSPRIRSRAIDDDQDKNISFVENCVGRRRTRRVIGSNVLEARHKISQLGPDWFLSPSAEVGVTTTATETKKFDYFELYAAIDAQYARLVATNPDLAHSFNEKWLRDSTTITSWELKTKMVNDITCSVEIADSKAKLLHQASAANIGLELVQALVSDVLGRDTTAAKLFTSKAEEDFQSLRTVGRALKAVCWIFVVLINAFFLWYCVRLGMTEGREFQIYVVIVFFVQMFFEIFVFETMEVVIVQYFTPRLAVGAVQDALSDIKGTIALAFDQEATPIKNELDATEFFFVAKRLRIFFPTLIESDMISIYSSYMPGRFGERWSETSTIFQIPKNIRKVVGTSIFIPAVMLLQFVGSISLKIEKVFVRLVLPSVSFTFIFMVLHPFFLLIIAFLIALELVLYVRRRRKSKQTIYVNREVKKDRGESDDIQAEYSSGVETNLSMLVANTTVTHLTNSNEPDDVARLQSFQELS